MCDAKQLYLVYFMVKYSDGLQVQKNKQVNLTFPGKQLTLSGPVIVERAHFT